MKIKPTTPLLASLGALVLVSTLFLSFYFSTGAYRTESTGIILPSDSAETPPLPDGDGDTVEKFALQNVQITCENVQEVVASLVRPASYSYTVRNTLHYSKGTHTVTRRLLVKNGTYRLDELSNDGTLLRSSLVHQNRLFAWENGASTYFEGVAGTFSVDAAAMLPTYEDVLALSRDSIAEASLVNVNYEPCVYVRATTETNQNVFYISTVSGLLVRADVYEGEALVRSCVVSSVSEDTPPDNVFILPSGKSVFTVEGTT